MDRLEPGCFSTSNKDIAMNKLSPDAFVYLLTFVTAFWAIIFILCAISWWRSRKAQKDGDMQFQQMFSLLVRAVEADEKHNEVGEKLVEEARRLQTTIKTREADEPLPEEPKFLTTIN